jgi:hypothetical protein
MHTHFLTINGERKMTNPISSTQKRIIDTKPLGNDWGKIVEDIVAKAGAELAETQLKIGKQTTSDEVVVQVPLTVYIGFPRKGQGIDGTAATVSAVCVWYGNDGGTGGVCVCTGPGAAACDCTPIVVPPIVA